ncbi:helix-turn-helix domain-containing protein [Anaerocellum danielii]|uniref:Helix-turn-helix domain-containing protein n=1 Tax=Anaerocellum danielii TaxID=1387557 RepID=A0ABZ0TXR4_9FIRM|nr:helix-turn-helix domain-containing protein [Caldicellulosiruptor danielii]WPX08232.1 helix-turn-helix domain-containing protein [Caldicellulosiruptor danielii]
MFPYRLKELREEKGLTQEELALMLGLKRQSISNYENGGRQPDYNTLIKIADFFGVTVDYLIGHSDFRTREEEFKGKNFYEKYKLDEVIGGSLDSESKAILGNILVNNVEPLIRNISGVLYQHLFGEEKKEVFILLKNLLENLNSYFEHLLKYSQKPAYFIALKSDYEPVDVFKWLLEKHKYVKHVSDSEGNLYTIEKEIDNEIMEKIITEVNDIYFGLPDLLSQQGGILASLWHIENFYTKNIKANFSRILKLLGMPQEVIDIISKKNNIIIWENTVKEGDTDGSQDS